MWVVIASLGVVALAGLTLRVDRPKPTRAERQIARRVEHVRRVEQWRRDVELKLREAPQNSTQNSTQNLTPDLNLGAPLDGG